MNKSKQFVLFLQLCSLPFFESEESVEFHSEYLFEFSITEIDFLP